jgi:hypothetical protein
MLVNSVPFGAPACDSLRAIHLALDLGWIESCQQKFKLVKANAFPHLVVKCIPRQLHAAGLAMHLPIGPTIETNLILAIPQPSPRNPKSRVPPAQQLLIYRAAEAKRARKEAQRALDAGESVEDML